MKCIPVELERFTLLALHIIAINTKEKTSKIEIEIYRPPISRHIINMSRGSKTMKYCKSNVKRYHYLYVKFPTSGDTSTYIQIRHYTI